MITNNNIELITKNLAFLDEKYQMESVTSFLDLSGELVRETMDAKSVLIPVMTLQGLADYNRNGGYTTGDAALEWKSHTFTQDRGRMFGIDTMDNIETAGLAYGRLAGEFIRLHVAPELDAYRLSTYANSAAPANVVIGVITAANVISALIAGRTRLVNNHVPADDLVIFATPDVYGALMEANQISQTIMIDNRTPGGIELEIDTFNRSPIFETPGARLMTAYTFYDGTTSGQTQGGFTPASGAAQINFIMMARNAVLQIVKRAAPKIIIPEQNQTADGWSFGYRLYHDAFITENQKSAIYVHRAA
jgi:hypothetical protein